MKGINLKDLQKTSIYILILGCLLLIFFRNGRLLVSFALGSALMIINLRVLKWIVETALKREEKRKWFFLFLPLQFLLLLGFISIVILYGNIEPVFFLIGISTFFIAILINSLQFSGRQNAGT